MRGCGFRAPHQLQQPCPTSARTPCGTCSSRKGGSRALNSRFRNFDFTPGSRPNGSSLLSALQCVYAGASLCWVLASFSKSSREGGTCHSGIFTWQQKCCQSFQRKKSWLPAPREKERLILHRRAFPSTDESLRREGRQQGLSEADCRKSGAGDHLPKCKTQTSVSKRTQIAKPMCSAPANLSYHCTLSW